MGVTINSRPYGKVEVEESRIIDFPDGIPGFDFVKKFAILDVKDDESPFKWMQAAEETDLAFVIISPADFMPDYELDISRSDLESIGADIKTPILVYAIVTIPENPADMTANLQGPVIINPAKKLGRQAISLSDKYIVRHRIVDEINRSRGGE